MMRFATIGTSWITEMFIKAAQKSQEAELIAVYSRSKKTARVFAQKNGAMDWYTDLDVMLDGSADFIYIASPNSMHHEQIINCLEKGKHVFCEKPMVYTENQWYEIHECAKKHDVFLFEGFRHLFSPNYQVLQDTIEEIGQIRSVMLQYVQYSSRYDAYQDGQAPNVFSKEFAGGVLLDLGVYPLSMALDLFGEPNDIDYFPVLLANGIDGSGTLVLTYHDFIVTILCSKIAQATIPSEIHGEDGTLTMDHIAPIKSLMHYDRKIKSSMEMAKPQDNLDMVYQVQAFVKMIKEKDIKRYENWMERSRLVAKWSEKARKKQGILFPGDSI